MRTVLVFKTSVTSHQMVRQVKPILNKLLAAPEKWNFDLEDCDNILRVEAFSVQAPVIITHLQKAGFECAELED